MTQPDTISDEYKYYLLRKRHAENLILNAFRGLRHEGIEPVLIKGWAAARNYPESKPRFSGDIDLAVSAHDYERTKTLLESGIGGVDLHNELRHLDSVDWQQLIANSQLVKLDDEDIRVLSAEDHLRVMCVHWLTDGGENRERLWDIVYAVRNRPADFDWSKCLNVVSVTRQKWIIATIGIAHKYLGLELEGVPFADEARKIPAWMTRCLEKEWAKGLELRALESQLKYPRSLLKQIAKRIPPNPIQAMVNCEADLSGNFRMGFQIRDMFKRLMPSVRRVSSAIRGR